LSGVIRVAATEEMAVMVTETPTLPFPNQVTTLE
jgi:hypothetical protein